MCSSQLLDLRNQHQLRLTSLEMLKGGSHYYGLRVEEKIEGEVKKEKILDMVMSITGSCASFQ